MIKTSPSSPQICIKLNLSLSGILRPVASVSIAILPLNELAILGVMSPFNL